MPPDLGSTLLLGGVGLALYAYLIAFVVKAPHALLWASFPVLMWPTTPIAIQAAVVVALVSGAAICAFTGKHSMPPKPTLLYLSFAAVMTFGLFLHGAPAVVSQTNARNSFIAMLLSVALVPVVAVLQPPLRKTLVALAISGALSSGYTLLIASNYGGRAALDTYNSDAVGLAAVAAMLAAGALFVLTRKARWLVVSLVPSVLFLQAQTRSALVVLVLAPALLWVMLRASPMRILTAVSALVVAPLVADAAVKLQMALFSTRDPRHLEVDSRLEVLKLAGKVIADEPLFGVGWRHFTDESLHHLGVVINAHNDYALIAAEGGLIALGLMAGMLSRFITFREAGPDGRILRAVGLSLAAGLAFGNLLTDLRVVLPLWVLLGIAWSVDRNPPKPTRRNPKQASTALPTAGRAVVSQPQGASSPSRVRL